MASYTTGSNLHDADTRLDPDRASGEGMSESFPPPYRAAAQRAMARLDGFARGLGLDEATTREIVEKVVVEMPLAEDEERLVEARYRMIVASA